MKNIYTNSILQEVNKKIATKTKTWLVIEYSK